MSTEKIPLVSVIIPMYNAERFISQTLESLLYQTLKDFEVVVADDCSTDNSVEVVENFSARFDGRLHVIKLPTNSGTPEVPRNTAINFSRGKYIAFLDSDDLFTKTALEELTTLAEKHQADVINTTEFFCFNDGKSESATTEKLLSMKHNIISSRNVKTPRLQQATELPADLGERLKLWTNNEIHWATWATFCKRDFLTVNDIRFPIMPVGGDQLFNFACLCLSKKFLRAPNVTYIYRQRADSISHDSANAEKYFRRLLKDVTVGFKEFNKIMSRVPTFAKRPDYRYTVFDWFFNKIIGSNLKMATIYTKIHPAAMAQFIEQEIHSDDAAFLSYLFNVVNVQNLKLMSLRTELKKFYKQ